MAGKAPKITQAQRELERAQVRALKEQERERNLEVHRVETFNRRLLLGEVGQNLLLRPRPSIPAAQAKGGTISPSLMDPAVAALEKQTAFVRMAEGFGKQARDNIRALTTPSALS